MRRTAESVWMVHARTGLDGLRGALLLEGRRLVFRPSSPRAGEAVFELADVKRVRRAPGSPVLEVHLRAGFPRVVGFYFVEPPSLTEPEFRRVPLLPRKWLARRQALSKLREGNVLRGHEVDGWVEAIRAALAALWPTKEADAEPGP
jgi:hypothetical protein